MFNRCLYVVARFLGRLRGNRDGHPVPIDHAERCFGRQPPTGRGGRRESIPRAMRGTFAMRRIRLDEMTMLATRRAPASTHKPEEIACPGVVAVADRWSQRSACP